MVRDTHTHSMGKMENLGSTGLMENQLRVSHSLYFYDAFFFFWQASIFQILFSPDTSFIYRENSCVVRKECAFCEDIFLQTVVYFFALSTEISRRCEIIEVRKTRFHELPGDVTLKRVALCVTP